MKESLEIQRSKFEFKTWRYGNELGSFQNRLFNAGKLGFCVLTWNGNTWENKWFDKMEKVKK